MNSKQFELLLNQLFDCSLAINNAIKNDLIDEIDKLLKIKDDKIELIQSNKKFINNVQQFNNLIEQIKKQDDANIELLSRKKEETFKESRKNQINTKILKKYEQLRITNGSIVDIKE